MDRITEVTRECFGALIQLRRLEEASLPPVETLQQGMRVSIDALFRRAQEKGFSREDTNDIAYAIVALADDIALSRSTTLRDSWAGRSLQLHYFHENVAGEAFFTRLEGLRRDQRRREILRVYYLALLFGFQGRHRVRGGELELLKLIQDLHDELSRGSRFDGEVLSPSGERPQERDPSNKRVGLAAWCAAGALALALLTYAGVRLAIDLTASDVAQRIESVELR